MPTAPSASLDWSALLRVLESRPKTPANRAYAYGTAGFRGRVDEGSESVFARVGAVAWCRAVATGSAVGLCVTASHNPEHDNGVKLVDPDGGMLDAAWEPRAARVVNAATAQDALALIQQLYDEAVAQSAASASGSGSGSASATPLVLTARDTRSHSERLEGDALAACAAFPHARAQSLGVLTTPQLHYCVMRLNGRGFGGEATEAGYYAELADAFVALLRAAAVAPPASGADADVLAVDCANGVGALKLPLLTAAVNERLREANAEAAAGAGHHPPLACVPFNTATADFARLNEGCGAEHVQKERKAPAGAPALPRGARMASLDGDADRIVYFAVDCDQLRLLDGDKIAALLARLVRRELEAVAGALGLGLDAAEAVGCVQTAYANGASTRFLRDELKVGVPLVKTGVKHLHHRAHEFPVGVYFEANGHGTALFSSGLVEKLRALDASRVDARVARARDALLALARLLNQATGDALADLLAVEAALRVLGLDLAAWDAWYADLPSRQLKVKVPDRGAVRTTDDETRCVAPRALQDRIDAAVAKYERGRAFARPSGTEDVVRVYAEAGTRADADALAGEVERAIVAVLGGESGGESPSKRGRPAA